MLLFFHLKSLCTINLILFEGVLLTPKIETKILLFTLNEFLLSKLKGRTVVSTKYSLIKMYFSLNNVYDSIISKIWVMWTILVNSMFRFISIFLFYIYFSRFHSNHFFIIFFYLIGPIEVCIYFIQGPTLNTKYETWITKLETWNTKLEISYYLLLETPNTWNLRYLNLQWTINNNKHRNKMSVSSFNISLKRVCLRLIKYGF